MFKHPAMAGFESLKFISNAAMLKDDHQFKADHDEACNTSQ